MVFTFRYEMVYSIDGGWGGLLNNGSYSGMVGMLARNEASIAVSDFYITLDRKGAVDFSVALGLSV